MGRTMLLLRPLFTRGRRNTVKGPRLNVAVITVATVHWNGVTGLAVPHCKHRGDRFDATGLRRICVIQMLIMKAFRALFVGLMFLSFAGLVALAQTPATKSTASSKAIAVLHPTAGNKVNGAVTFTPVADGVRIYAELAGLTPGKHGFHVHEFGDCSAADASSAGAHFNPTSQPHAGPDTAARHEGDMGNIEADASGNAKLDYVDHQISLANDAKSVIGRSVVVHAKSDDLKTQPSGDSGARIACGVIGWAKSQ